MSAIRTQQDGLWNTEQTRFTIVHALTPVTEAFRWFGQLLLTMTNPRFVEVKEEAAEAVTDDGLRSIYTGLIYEDGRHEYYLGNDTETATELREAAAIQLGMLVRVLADRSDSTVEEITTLAAERAQEMQLR